MKAIMIIPDSPARKTAGIRQRSRLIWTTEHSQSRYGAGVLLYHNGNLLNGFNFRGLRDRLGARILTTDSQRVCRALGVPEGERGIDSV